MQTGSFNLNLQMISGASHPLHKPDHSTSLDNSSSLHIDIYPLGYFKRKPGGLSINYDIIPKIPPIVHDYTTAFKIGQIKNSHSFDRLCGN